MKMSMSFTATSESFPTSHSHRRWCYSGHRFSILRLSLEDSRPSLYLFRLFDSRNSPERALKMAGGYGGFAQTVRNDGVDGSSAWDCGGDGFGKGRLRLQLAKVKVVSEVTRVLRIEDSDLKVSGSVLLGIGIGLEQVMVYRW
ncbi:hypothetical protein V6N11_024140 [Hibiscus sabdariffa]|uniref:Uncharacterized protein n=1 Tax=Hibiscus sabdariffa TaxID=183260 RepID=A0ABR2ACN7_9ROSI